MVRGAGEPHAGGREAAQRRRELGARGHQDREVKEPGRARRPRRRLRARRAARVGRDRRYRAPRRRLACRFPRGPETARRSPPSARGRGRPALRPRSASGRGASPRSVAEQRVPVLAPLVGELGDRRHALVVVRLDLAEAAEHPVGGTAAERIRDVALLARRLDALVLEDRGDPREDGDLRVDVGQRVGDPLLLKLGLDDALAVLSQKLSEIPCSSLTCSATASAWLFSSGWARPIRIGAYLALDPAADVVGQDADRADRVVRPISPSSESFSPTGLRPVRATKARRTSFAPSKIGKIRMSRRIFS